MGLKKSKTTDIINAGINSTTYDLLFKDYDLSDEERQPYEEFIAWLTIDRFTKIEEKRIFSELLKTYYKNMENIDLNKITYNDESKQYEYNENGTKITFDKISNMCNDEEIIKELTSNKRYGICHGASVNLAPSFPNSKVLTGYVTIDNQKCLHSVVEYESEGVIYILDWTRNLKITKEQYIKLTCFVEISSFDSKHIINDQELIIDNLNIDTKVYSVFRDEIMKDVYKNPHIFVPTEETKELMKAYKEEVETRYNHKSR